MSISERFADTDDRPSNYSVAVCKTPAYYELLQQLHARLYHKCSGRWQTSSLPHGWPLRTKNLMTNNTATFELLKLHFTSDASIKSAQAERSDDKIVVIQSSIIILRIPVHRIPQDLDRAVPCIKLGWKSHPCYATRPLPDTCFSYARMLMEGTGDCVVGICYAPILPVL